ncbi:hypothetical protein [Demequina litorisediminis]|uniref:hypothetical protein n=1 Tax=Demequina litorisediminis TaxID=1849022 RepID=UPI003D663F34
MFADYESTAPAAGDAAQYAIDGSAALTAIDYSDVCLNYDIAYFEDNGLEVPQEIGDLTDPQYAGLLSITNPATSSPASPSSWRRSTSGAPTAGSTTGKCCARTMFA